MSVKVETLNDNPATWKLFGKKDEIGKMKDEQEVVSLFGSPILPSLFSLFSCFILTHPTSFILHP